MDRRKWLELTASGSLGMAAAGLTKPLQGTKSINSDRVLRIAHITDVHMQPQKGAEAGFIKCLENIHSLAEPVDFIVNGGDSIMDALKKDYNEVDVQWKLWTKVLEQNVSLPMYHCIGNHDVWGRTPHKEPYPGKAWAMDNFGLQKPYYTFSKNGWHFIVLDSTHPKSDGSWYTAKLDEVQFTWLKETLAQIPAEAPILILSHIPIFAACPFLDGNNEKSGNWEVPGAWMHIDCRAIIELLYNYKNVKTCISGHIHLLDRVDYNDITYFCNGAVSGRWWADEPYHQTPAGYAIMNLYEDGSFDREFIFYDA